MSNARPDGLSSSFHPFAKDIGDGKQVDVNGNINHDPADSHANAPHEYTQTESGAASPQPLFLPTKPPTTISKPANEGRIAYRASVFEDCQYEVINVKGEIHNSAGPGHLPFLYDLLSKGLITPDKLCDMYSALMHADRATVSEVSTVVNLIANNVEMYFLGSIAELVFKN
ncbi:hypothetical protein BDQ17DRAFT_1412227 [Cyathus striatus]|nr:hypothetical protein BDQ17DRAFT_1412227 [Cyathus striatus]